MSEPLYGPWQRGLICMPRRILAPLGDGELPVVEVDWSPPLASEPDWRRDTSVTGRELAAELVRVAGERDLAVKAAAEAGFVLEGIRLAVVYELAPEILAAIDQALELVHEVIGDGAPTGRQEDRERP